MKIIFMGTPLFAVPIAEEIKKKHEIVLVVTQPDQYNYKKKTVTFSPVKNWAIENNLPIFQPEKIKLEKEEVFKYDADLIVTAAFGQIIPEDMLEFPKYKAINVHGSLLPKYRGGAPIQRAIINGDSKTGITIMYMAKKMDAGDIIKMSELPILDSDNQDTVFEKLSLLGKSMILDVIDALEKGNVVAIPQNEDEVTYAYNLTKEDELINFNKTARDVFNQIRGLNSNPGAYFKLDDLNIKVYDSFVSEQTTNAKPGTIIGISKKSFEISCSDGTVISITEVQLPSKNKMPARDFINGQGRKLLTIGKEINSGDENSFFKGGNV